MKTRCELEILSKLHLLKDLADGIFREVGLFPGGGAYAGIANLSKSLENHCYYQTANVIVITLAIVEHKGSRKNAGVECD
jgi:hypothetical protein